MVPTDEFERRLFIPAPPPPTRPLSPGPKTRSDYFVFENEGLDRIECAPEKWVSFPTLCSIFTVVYVSRSMPLAFLLQLFNMALQCSCQCLTRGRPTPQPLLRRKAGEIALCKQRRNIFICGYEDRWRPESLVIGSNEKTQVKAERKAIKMVF